MNLDSRNGPEEYCQWQSVLSYAEDELLETGTWGTYSAGNGDPGL